MGKNVFTQVSGALAPLRDALAQTLNRRAVDIWKDRPQAHALLQRTAVKDLMEPVPQPILKPTATIREVGRAFVEHGNEFFFVSSDGQTLEGIVTITDLIRGQTESNDTLVTEFMTKNPVTVAADDDCTIAANIVREYRLKTVPVVEGKSNRKMAGCIRIRRMMAFVLKETAGKDIANDTSPSKEGEQATK
jgi:CBS domain-containing protein